MWNWLKNLLGFGAKEYHHLLDDAHNLHDDISDFIGRKAEQADDLRAEIDAKVTDLNITQQVAANAEALRAGVVNALTATPAKATPAKAAPVDGHANVAAQ
jgi:hypothetical protein